MATPRLARPLDAWARKKPKDAVRAVGGLGARLLVAARRAAPVEPTWVIEAAIFRDRVRGDLPPGHSPASLLRLRSPRVMAERAAHAHARLLEMPLPRELDQDLAAIAAEAPPEGLLVRLSTTLDDDELARAAGLVLALDRVRGAGALADAVRTAWSVATSPRALAFLAARDVHDVAAAVLVQPATRALGACVVRAAPDERGVRAAVLDVVAWPGRALPTAERSARAIAARTTDGAADDAAPAPAEDASTSLLTAPRLAELASIARRLDADEEPRAWVVELALTEDRCVLLDARAGAGDGCPSGGDAETVWSRASPSELLSRPATPLTLAVGAAVAERGLRRALTSLGCSVPRGTALVTDMRGRLYLNLTAIYRVAAQVPGPGASALVELGGGPFAARLAAQVAEVSRRGFWARLPLTATRVVGEHLRLEAEVERFELDAARARRRIGDLDLAILPDDALVTTLRDVRRLLDDTGALLLTCATAAAAAHLAVVTLVARAEPLAAERVAEAISSALGDLETAAPGLALLHVAAIARRDGDAAEAIARGALRLDDVPEGPTRRALAQLLATFGDRAARDAELAEPRWAEDPAPVLAALRAALRGEPRDPDVALARARAASARARDALDPKLSVLERAALHAVLPRSERLLRLRERMRAWTSRVLAMLRAVALDADRRLARLDPSIGPGGAFFCTPEEIEGALAAGRARLGEVVAARRAEHARDRAEPDPAPTFVGAPPRFGAPRPAVDVLRGLPASGGASGGRARWLVDDAPPAAFAPGDVLFAESIAIAHAPWIALAGGLVVEHGGPLSDAALIAREYGVPAVVGVGADAWAIADGEVVRVDGDAGVVSRDQGAS